jgi:hypothetical protein
MASVRQSSNAAMYSSTVFCPFIGQSALVRV